MKIILIKNLVTIMEHNLSSVRGDICDTCACAKVKCSKCPFYSMENMDETAAIIKKLLEKK